MTMLATLRGTCLRAGVLSACALLAVGCGPPGREQSGDDESAPDASPIKADAGDGCAAGADLVYVFDNDNHLFNFEPSTKTFTDIGKLDCPVTPTTPPGTPFSMAIDRSTTAWVVYTNGDMFKVDINNQLACTRIHLTGLPTGMSTFGMGFSTDTPGSTDETLFLWGAFIPAMPDPMMFLDYGIAKVDPATMAATMIASDKVDIAEMTGNSNAELWAFAARPSPHIMQVDKTNGSFIKDFAEPGITQTNPALAFAHWGGDYWAFVMDRTDPSSTVYQMDGVTGAMKSTTPNTGRYIVGAGVSTCAPLVIL